MQPEDVRKILEEKTLDELKSLARSVGLRGYSGLSKRDLLEALVTTRFKQLATHFGPKSFWSEYHNHIYGIIGIVGVLVSLPALFPAFTWPQAGRGVDDQDQADWTAQYTRTKPKIVGIYPPDAFGPLRKSGLHAFVDDYPEVKVVDIEVATVADMKTGNVKKLQDALSSILSSDNVLGVVGPPITECTRAILETVAESGQNVPVFIESAGAPSAIGWQEFGSSVPIFRISSGVDKRASEMAWLIKDLLSANRRVQLLIEQNPGAGQRTYGEHVYEEIKRHIDSWSDDVNRGLIDAAYFPTADIDSRIAEIELMARSGAVIVLLGLGHHYKSVINSIYRRTDKDEGPQSCLVSWMTAYSTDSEFRNGGDFRYELLFEITDLNIIDAGPKPDLFGKFQTAFARPSPANRDQAFSFDAGYCLVDAYHDVAKHHFPDKPGYYPRIDEGARQRVVEVLRSNLYRGITGDIRFGSNGQNNDGRLIFAQFDPIENTWKATSPDRILSRAQAVIHTPAKQP